MRGLAWVACLVWLALVTKATAQNTGSAQLNGVGHLVVPTLPAMNTLTMEGWVRLRSFSGDGRIVELGNSGWVNNQVILQSHFDTSGRPRFVFGAGGVLSTVLDAPTGIPLNVWTHVAGVIESSRLCSLYVNGVKVAAAVASGLPNNVSRAVNYIGISEAPNSGRTDGSVADIRIWNVARTEAQIRDSLPVGSITGSTPGLVAAYPFGATGAAAAADVSGNNRSLTTAGTVQFNSTGPGILTTSSASNAITAGLGGAGWYATPSLPAMGSTMTLEGWVFPRSYANWGRLLDLGNGAGNNNVVLAASSGTSGRPNFTTLTGSTGSLDLNSPVAIPLNVWTHLAATINSDRSAQLYVNGVSVASGTASSLPPTVTRSSNLIGKSNWEQDSLFGGSVADVRIWNVVRTQAQIQESMPVGSITGPTTGLVAAYPFGSTGSGVLNDVSGNARNLIQVGPVAYAKHGTGSVQSSLSAVGAFRYYRLVPTALRGGTSADAIQLGEFQMLLNGDRLSGATATNPGGANNSGQGPAQANDNNLGTKWIDITKTSPLVLDFGTPVVANAYRLATADDVPNRDPISWRLEASLDNTVWVTLDTESNFSMPAARNTYTASIGMNSLSSASSLTVSQGTLTLDGDGSYAAVNTVNAGTLALSGSASLGGSSTITVAGGARLDTTGRTTALALGSNQTLSNMGRNALISGNLGAEAGTLSLSLDGATPAFTVSAGTLTVGSAAVLRFNNTGSALAAGTYKVVAKDTGGAVSGVAPATVLMEGAGIAAGMAATAEISGGELFLKVAAPQMAGPGGNNVVMESALNNAAWYSLPPLPAFGNEITLEAWVNPRSAGTWPNVVNIGNGFANDNIVLLLDASTLKPAIYMSTTAAGNWTASITAPAAIPLNQWSHLAGVIGSDRSLRLYVNGQLVVSGTSTANIGSVVRGLNVVGNIAGSGAGAQVLDGSIADVRIWGVARTQVQIQAAMAVGSVSGATTGLVAAYPFGATGSGVLADVSGNARNLMQLGPVAYAKGGSGSIKSSLSAVGAFRYYRLVPTALRGGASTDGVQLSEFQMLFNGTRLSGATASNPGGSNSGTTAQMANDNSVGTKWFDSVKTTPLVLDFGTPTVASSYRFATADDVVNRDPTSWRLEASLDNATWVTLDTESNYPMPTARNTYTASIDIGSLALGSSLTVAAGTFTLDGSNAYSGATTISGGTLSVGDGGTTGALGSGNVVNNATLVLNRSDSVTVSNVISGTGSLQKYGSGTATLTGANSYSGTTVVGAGTLALSGSGSLGSSASITVVSGAALDVSGRSSALALASSQSLANQSGSGTLMGNINAASGTLALVSMGSAAPFTVASGTFTVAAGTTLRVNRMGSAMVTGTYKLVAKSGTGLVSGVAPSSVVVEGAGMAAGLVANAQVTGGELVLAVGTPVDLTLGGLAQAYDGTPRAVSVTTQPAGVGVVVTYNGSATVPVHAGSYAVVATSSNPAYVGSVSGTLVVSKGAATLQLGGLIQSYDGTARKVVATTVPPGLTWSATYNGSINAPTNVGSYAVIAAITDTNYTGTTSGVLSVRSAAPGTRVPATPNPPSYLNHQGFLSDASGNPLGSPNPRNYDLVFRIYAQARGGTALWAERQSATLDRGKYSVMLGEGANIDAEPWPMLHSVLGQGDGTERHLEVTVRGIGLGGTDVTMTPRFRLLSLPYAFLARHARTADTLVGSNGVALVRVSGNSIGVNVEQPNAGLDVGGTLSTTTFATPGNATVNGVLAASAFVGKGTIPVGGIVAWAGTVPPRGWALCDGQTAEGRRTPDLRGRFVLGQGAGSGLTARAVGQVGGSELHVLGLQHLASHTHVFDPVASQTSAAGAHAHGYASHAVGAGYWPWPSGAGADGHTGTHHGEATMWDSTTHTHRVQITGTTTTLGGGRSHPGMPPFYVLAYIMRVL